MNTTRANKVTMFMDDQTLGNLLIWIQMNSAVAKPEQFLDCHSTEVVDFDLDTYEEVTA
jgi:hypothetical protein